MFDNLSERLERSFKILKGEGKITEINVAETLKDVRKALLDADVNSLCLGNPEIPPFWRKVLNCSRRPVKIL